MIEPLTAASERFAAKAQSAATQLHVRSALNPMLWLCGIITLPCITIAAFLHGIEPVSTVLLWTGVCPVAVASATGIYFAIAKPEKLQSEDFQLRHETLELIKQKGSPIEISPSSLEIISNPACGAKTARLRK